MSPGAAMSTGADQVPPTGCVEALTEISVSPSSTHAAVALPAASTATSTSTAVSLSSSVTIGDVHVGAAPAGTAASEPARRRIAEARGPSTCRSVQPLGHAASPRVDAGAQERSIRRTRAARHGAGPTIWVRRQALIVSLSVVAALVPTALGRHGDLVGARRQLLAPDLQVSLIADEPFSSAFVRLALTVLPSTFLVRLSLTVTLASVLRVSLSLVAFGELVRALHVDGLLGQLHARQLGLRGRPRAAPRRVPPRRRSCPSGCARCRRRR